ncbi:tetratricopeptide repeat protein [Sorangium sp. So ce542]|uniref:tetratricopeptide repeat protein n=1 Tax=Sorangium sp. So ce542 TaxID=3133316 RepID=UPI003F617454
MKRGLSFLGPGVLLGAVALSGAASAQRAERAVKPVAEALFRQGRELFKRGQFAEACDKFQESQRLEPKPGTLLNLAVCHEKVGKLATAWAELGSVEEIARREGRKDREGFARAQREALEERLARLEVRMAEPPAGLRLTLDGEPLNGAALNAPFPIDPGRHRVAAAAPGKRAWSTEVEVPSERAAIVVAVPALEDAPPAAPGSAGAPPPPRAGGPVSGREPRAGSAGMVLAATGFSVGAIGLGVGAVAGALTLARSGALAEACPDDRCPPSRRGELDAANTLANVSNAGFAVLAIGAGVGVAGLLMLPAQGSTSGARAALTPVLGPGVIGLRAKF